MAQRTFKSILKATFTNGRTDHISKLAAALAFYTAFSIAPLVVVVVGLVGAIFQGDLVRREVFSQIRNFLGAQSAGTIESIVSNLSQYSKENIMATVIGLVVILFGAGAVFSEIRSSLNYIWKVSPKRTAGLRAAVRSRFLSFAMVLVVGFLLTVSLLFSALLSGITKYAAGIIPGGAWLWQGVNFVFSFGLITLLFALIFKVLPENRETSWKDIWIGAGFTSLFFTIGKTLLGFYLGRTSVTSIYGAAGSFVVILVWVYYAAQILYFGAEFTRAYSGTKAALPLSRLGTT